MRALLFITGFVSSSVQFIMLREIVCMSGGCEVTTGIFLALWLILSSLGAAIAQNKSNVNLRRLFLLFITTPLLSLFCLLVSTRILLHTGEVPSLLITTAIILITLAPTAIISSRTFIILSTIRKEKLKKEPGRSFGLETVGSVLAGVFSTVTATMFIPGFLYYLLVIVLSGVIILLILFSPSGKSIAILFISTITVIWFLIILPTDSFIRSFQLRSINVTETYDTPFGNITSGTYNGEKTVYYDFRPLFSGNDNVRCEEDVHYAMLQATKHNKILLISGGLRNHLKEIAKYEPSNLLYIEHDPGLIRVEKISDTIINSLKISVVSEDAFSFLKKNIENFDVIIQLVPQPTILSVNRYYCCEYFANIKKNLVKDGIFACTPLPAYNYVSENYIKTLSPVINALRMSFRNVTVIQGNMLYLIASDSGLTDSICNLVKKKGINNSYVNCDYLNDGDINRRTVNLLSRLDEGAAPNRLIKPVSAWYGNSFQLEKQGTGKGVIAGLLLLILLPFLIIKRSNIIMYSSSAGLASLGMIVIFLFQTIMGNAHLLSAIVLSLMMTGLAIGSSINLTGIKSKVVYPSGIAAIFLLTGIFSLCVNSLRTNLLLLVFLFFLVFLGGILAGSLYHVLTLGGTKSTTGNVYVADLAGSAAGYLFTGTIFIPLAGISATSFILAGIILISLTLAPVTSKL
jgi:predicted membrane-bound spermidine synthase